MNSLLGYFIEANLYLVCFYLLYQILLVRDKHFRFNRAFLLGGVCLSMILPVLSFHVAPEPSNAFEGYIILPVITITSVQTESVGFLLKWWNVIAIVYLAGMSFYLLRLFWQMAQIMRHLPLLNSSREKKDGYTLVTTNGEIPTCSFFKYLLWDKSADLTEVEKKQIFEHELTHIRQGHSIDVLVVEFLRALFWFNPVIHLFKSRITEVHEYLADHQATKQIGIEHYSRLLTLQIFNKLDFALSNNFHKSQVVKRIRMLKSTNSRSLWVNVTLLIPVLALLISVLSCDVAQEILPNSVEEGNVIGLRENLATAGKNMLSQELQSRLGRIKEKLVEPEIMPAKNLEPEEEFELQSAEQDKLDIQESDNNSAGEIASPVESDAELKSEPIVPVEDITLTEEYTSDEIFTIVEDQPAPHGGMLKFYEYVQANLKYPAQARRMGIEGKVFVQFVVAKDGSLTDVKAVKGIGAGCDAEAVRVISSSPDWKPGIQRNRAVNVRMILPITFKLG